LEEALLGKAACARIVAMWFLFIGGYRHGE
jgi:hypothetical protein